MTPQRSLSDVWRGFRTILPLWLATAPAALAYVVTAKKAGLSDAEIQFFSLTVSSAVTQLSLLSAPNMPLLAALLTVILLNIHYVMYGLSLSRRMPFTKTERFAAGLALTDAVYGMTVADARAGLFFLLGAEMSMFAAWNLLTAGGLLLHHLVLTVTLPPMDLVAPLSFCGMLVFTLKSRQEALVAVIAMGIAVVFNALGLKSAVILLTTVVAVGAGVWITRSQTAHEKVGP